MKKLILIALMFPLLLFGQSKIRNTQITSGNASAKKVLTSDGATNAIWDSVHVSGLVGDVPLFIKTDSVATITANVEYGYLYNWYVTTDSRKIASSDDWIVGSETQFNALGTFLGGNSIAGGKLKEIGTTHWDTPNTGATNEAGFNAKGSGIRGGAYAAGVFGGLKLSSSIWSSTGSIYGRLFAVYNSVTSLQSGNFEKYDGAAIRLLYTGSGTPTEYVGNNGAKYDVVQIGTQIWLAENLMETSYRDGSPIPVVTDNSAWAALTTGARCSYDNDEANAGTTTTQYNSVEVNLGDTIYVPDVTVFKLISDSTAATGYTRRDRLASELAKKVSDIPYDNTWDGVTTVAPSKNAIRDKISTMEMVQYCPTTLTVNTGTLVQGVVSDLCALGGTNVIVQENNGADPLRVTLSFSNVQRLTSFSFYGRYQGGAGHVVYIEAYNYNLSAWQLIGELGTNTTPQWYSYNIFLPTNFVSGGVVQVRFNHQGNGINTHQLILDYADVNYGGGGGSSFQTASEIGYVPTGTVASTNVQNAITELDSEKIAKVTSTDNAVVRYDGTTGAVQNSGVTVDDSNNITTSGKLELYGTAPVGEYNQLYVKTPAGIGSTPYRAANFENHYAGTYAATGIQSATYYEGANNQDHQYAVQSWSYGNGSGTIANMAGYMSAHNNNGAAVTNYYSFLMNAPTVTSGSISNLWAFYTKGNNMPSYLSKVRVGSVQPTTAAQTFYLLSESPYSDGIYGITSPQIGIFSNSTATIGHGGVINLGGLFPNTGNQYTAAFLKGAPLSATTYKGEFSVYTTSGGGGGETNSANYKRMSISQDGMTVYGLFDATGYKLSNTNLLLDNLKSGSIGASGTILTSTGATTQPTWQTLLANGTDNFIPKYSSNTLNQSILNVTGSENLMVSTYKGANSDGMNIFIGGGGQNSIGVVGETYKGSNNTSNGVGSLNGLTTGYLNVAIGRYSLRYLNTGTNNTAIGAYSLENNAASSNVAVGTQSLDFNTSGYNNTAIGAYSGRYYGFGSDQNTNSINCLFIGNNTRPLVINSQNEIAIGYNTIGNGSNTATIGNSSVTTTYLSPVIILRNSTSSPTGIEGGVYYNSTTKHFYGYDGTNWKQLDN